MLRDLREEGSDAEAKGLQPGDQILELENVKPTRENWNELRYRIKILAPRSSLHVVIARPKQQPQLVVVSSVVKQRAAHFDLTSNEYWIYAHQFDSDMEKYQSRVKTIHDVMVVKLVTFEHKDDSFDGEFRKANNNKALVLDMRGNGGGSESFLLRLLGNVFDQDVAVGEIVGRSKSKPITAKAQHAFSGKLIVLVDSESASASEVYARVVQLEKRGTVIGDQTAGAVRRAVPKVFIHGQGQEYAYAMSVTVDDLKMKDGKSLEKTGVTPDETLLPTPEQLANGEDPQLARAFELAGVTLSPKEAGAIFPRKEN